MKTKHVDFRRDTRRVRRARELLTIQVMIRMFCRGQGHTQSGPICIECLELYHHAARRLERCVFGDAKPTCSNCVVHCYSADMRERIRAVMRWAGPRMLFRHPILGIAHLIDERRPVPRLPHKPVKPRDAGVKADTAPESRGS